MGNSVYIVSADAKDLFLYCYSKPGGEYSVRHRNSDQSMEYNTRKFINTLDYSLDLPKLREVYEKVYRRMDFTFSKRGKEYCRRVINVTFKYSVKEFNLFYGQTYIKFGYLPEDITLTDNVCIKDGELIAVRVGNSVDCPIFTPTLGENFVFEDGVYKTSKGFRVLYTVAQLREKLYTDGFSCDGIEFVRFKRSGGSSRVGKCLFIDRLLYPRMHKWEMCGLKVKNGQEIDLAALEAYISLTLSSITDILQLRPENFLVIDDYESCFHEDVIATYAGDDGWLKSEKKNVEIKNSIWDGQSLIDKSAMGQFESYGMVLLRNRFFKSACFNTNIQEFFRDNGISTVEQLNGFTLAKSIEDIKIITTPSSIKYLKFGKLEDWLNLLEEDGSFGVVKHEKPTHFFDGKLVQIHYQLLNTLQMTQEEVDRLVEPSLSYLKMIQEDPAVLRYHIKYSTENETIGAASTTSDVMYQMLGVTDKLAQTTLYHNFRADIVKAFRKTLARGHILVNGNYSTLLGNPLEMLVSSIGAFTGESQIGIGHIHSLRFEYGKTILGSRSPHVTMGNVLLTENAENSDVDRYFNLTNEIVCINSIGENILMRLSGADFDSDTMLLTDNEILIDAARKNYDRFLVPTSMVHAKKAVRHYTSAEKADLDIKTSVNKIGEIINLSQELNTMLWDRVNNGESFDDVFDLYCDIAKLDVMSGIEIDKAKKEFVVDNVAEIKLLKKKYSKKDEDGKQIKPNFFGKIARIKGYYDPEKKNYKFHDTTMDYLQHSINGYRSERTCQPVIPFSDLLVTDISIRRARYSQVDRILELVRTMRKQIKSVWDNTDHGLDNQTKNMIVGDIREEFYGYIKSIQLSRDTAYRLLLAIEEPANKDISRSLFYMLFALPNRSFLDLIEESKEPIGILEESDDGDVEIYNLKFKRVVYGA